MKEEIITISFHPWETKFEVANAATKQSTDWIYDIGDIIGGSIYSFYEFISQTLSKNTVSDEKINNHFW